MHVYNVCVFLRETFEQQRMDIRALQRELQANKKALEPKVSGSDKLVVSLSPDGVINYGLPCIVNV